MFISEISQDKFIHEYDVAEASCQHEQMEDLMAPKVPVPAVKQRELQGIDNASDRIDDAASGKPRQCLKIKCSDQRFHDDYTGPAHGDIDH